MRNNVTMQISTASRDKKPSFWRPYFDSHKEAVIYSLLNLWRNKISTCVTIVMIGIALSLPVSLWVFVENAKAAVPHWNDSAQISLYLKMGIAESQVNTLIKHLEEQPNVANVTYISPQQGLNEFQQQTGISDALAALKENPLPGVIVLQPKINAPAAINALLTNVKSLSTVDSAILDLQWAERLAASLGVVKRMTFAVGCLLACGILFIIGNAIYFSLKKYHEEIMVLQLIGASAAYIRRPFLYCGLWYGLLGALLAISFVVLLVAWIAVPVQQLAALYGNTFRLQNIDMKMMTNVFICGVFLGLLGAVIAVNKHIKI